MPTDPRVLEIASSRIHHIVVLMLENRSFDHMFGFLEHPRLERLKENDFENPLVPSDPGSRRYGVTSNASFSLPVDPPHSHLSVMKQLDGVHPSKMDGFVAAYLEKASGREPVPIIHWGRVEALVILLSGVLSMVALAIGESWKAAGVVSLVLAIAVTLKLLRLRSVIPNWWRDLGIGIAAALAVGVLGRTFGPHLSTAIGMGVLLAMCGSIVVWCRHSKPLYAHPSDPQQALDDAPHIMRCMPNDRIPALAKLARGFAVCTAWHCSVPGATWPNRNFAHAATSDGTTDIEIGLYRNPTIFERLSTANVRWHIYHDGMAQVMAFEKVWKDQGHHWFDFSRFRQHVEDGSLPAYSFIEPSHDGPTSNSQHPGNNLAPHADGMFDFQRGEALIADVYESLKANPKVFERTMLLITYDEHGGLFDHVPPPANVHAPTRKVVVDITRRFVSLFVTYVGSQFAFNVLGPRVPTVVVSPWIDAGTLDPTQYEHSSIVATVRSMFAPGSRPLNRRDREAMTFEALATARSSPRSTEDMPDLSAELTPTAPIFVPPPVAIQAADAGAGEPPTRTDLAVELATLARKVDKALARQGAPEVAVSDIAAPLLIGESIDEEIPHRHVVTRFQQFCEQQRDATPHEPP